MKFCIHWISNALKLLKNRFSGFSMGMARDNTASPTLRTSLFINFKKKKNQSVNRKYINIFIIFINIFINRKHKMFLQHRFLCWRLRLVTPLSLFTNVCGLFLFPGLSKEPTYSLEGLPPKTLSLTQNKLLDRLHTEHYKMDYFFTLTLIFMLP